MYLQKEISKKNCEKNNFSCHLEGHWRKLQDPETAPDPNPDALVRVRIGGSGYVPKWHWSATLLCRIRTLRVGSLGYVAFMDLRFRKCGIYFFGVFKRFFEEAARHFWPLTVHSAMLHLILVPRQKIISTIFVNLLSLCYHVLFSSWHSNLLAHVRSRYPAHEENLRDLHEYWRDVMKGSGTYLIIKAGRFR